MEAFIELKKEFLTSLKLNQTRPSYYSKNINFRTWGWCYSHYLVELWKLLKLKGYGAPETKKPFPKVSLRVV